MKRYLWAAVCVAAFLMSAACSPVKNLEASKAEGYAQPLQKVMIVAFAKQPHIRRQFENVIANDLEKRGVDAVASYKVLPELGEQVAPEQIFAKAKEVGAGQLILAKSIDKQAAENMPAAGSSFEAAASGGSSYDFYGQGFITTFRSNDSSHIMTEVDLYDVEGQKLAWTSLSRLATDRSKQEVINLFVPMLITQLEDDKLVPALPK